jgi:hypothetical protein
MGIDSKHNPGQTLFYFDGLAHSPNEAVIDHYVRVQLVAAFRQAGIGDLEWRDVESPAFVPGLKHRKRICLPEIRCVS